MCFAFPSTLILGVGAANNKSAIALGGT